MLAQALQELISVYLPADRRYALACNLAMPEQAQGAALFADISGFTILTEGLRRAHGARRGVEQLGLYLNQVYDAIIAEVDGYAGSVIGFSGDAITCWFDDTFLIKECLSGGTETQPRDDRFSPDEAPSGALRAVTCALAINKAMQKFATIQIARQGEFTLQVKVAVASGKVRRFVVGNPEHQLIDVAAGDTLVRMAEAEKLAAKGQVVVDEHTIEIMGEYLLVNQWIDAESGRYALVHGLERGAPLTPWPPLAAGALSEEQLRPWLLPAVYERLCAGLGEFLTELRPAVALFLRFSGIDFEQDRDAGDKLDGYIRWVQSVISRYEGALIQLTVGEKGSYFYVAFGAPKAHEDDPWRTVNAALELRTPPKRLDYINQVQIGISLGTMRTGAYGGKTRRTYGSLGDEVNLAARLMQLAKPDGEILISGYVLKAVGGLCHCQPLPPVQVKGKSAPVELAALLGLAQSPAETVAYRGQMVGRQDELQKLVQFFDPILDRRNADKAHPDRLLETRSEPRFAGVATILGEAGIGKSRLAYALRQNLEYALAASPHGNGKELQWWSCPADTILGQSLYPFKYFLRPYFEQNADEPVEENRRRFEAVMDRLLQGMDAAEGEDLRRQLDRTRSMLGALVDLHWEDSLYERLEPKLRFENTLLAFKALVQAESLRKPLVLHFEDAHALDPDSKALIKSLTHGVAAYPFGLLLTGRTADSGESSSDFQALDVDPQTPKLLIYLNELSVDQVCELAVQVLADAAQSEPVVVDDDLAQFLWEKTNGNPLFVEQLLLELRERKLVKLQDSRWQIECEGLAEAPDSLNALLIARLDRLEEGVKNAVKTASVIGREFEVPVLQEMLPTDDQLFTVIDVAKTEMVWAPAAGNRYAFRQSLLRDAAYYMQPASHVQSLHARAASAIQSVHPVDLSPHYADLAYHYSEAQEDGLALHYASLAGADSAARYANSQAIAYYQRALDSARRLKPAETLSARLSLHTALGELYFTIGQYQTASQHLEQALALAIECGDRDAQARACHRMGRVYESSGDYPRSLEWIQRGLDALGERKTAEMSEMLNTAGLIYSRQGDFDNALLYAQRCLQIAENLDDLSAQARAYNLLGHVTHLRGDSGQAVEHFQRALALYQQANDIKGQALAHNQIANASLPLGRWQEAAHHYTLARAIFEQIGDVYNRAFADNNLGWIATNQGRLDDAVYHYQQGLATLEQIGGSPYVLGAFHNNLGATYNRRGNTQAAESAMEHLKISQAYFEQAGARDWLAELYRHQASASLLAGDVTGARAQIEQALSLARELKMRGEEGNALRVLGEVEAAGGQLDLAEEHLRQSLEILAEVGYEYEGAYSQLILVELFIRQGRSDEATPLLAQCLGIFERLGAALELERARSLL